jgi:hypothetical protein
VKILKSALKIGEKPGSRFCHIGVISMVLASLLLGCQSETDEIQTAAMVGNRSISVNDLIVHYGLDVDPYGEGGQIDPELMREAARKWAIEQILIQEAEQRNLDQDQFLKERLANLRDEILIDMLYDQLTESISVDSADIRQNYDEYRNEYVAPHDQIDLVYVLAPGRTLADQVRREFQAKNGLEEVLALDDQLVGEEIGWVMEKEPNPKISKAAFALVPGGISYPLKYDTGSDYIIMLCRQRRQAGTVLPLAEVENRIKERLLSRKKSQAEKTFRDSLWTVYNPRILIEQTDQ